MSDPKLYRWFSYDPNDGFMFHRTKELAEEDALGVLEAFRNDAVNDGWSEDVEAVCWGEIHQRVHQVSSEPKSDDPDGEEYWDFNFVNCVEETPDE